MAEETTGAEGARTWGPRLHRPLIVIAVLMTLGALRLAAPVMVPLAFALFLIATFWPLQRRLQDRLPGAVALGITLAVFALVLAALSGALWYSGEVISDAAPRYAQEFERWRSRAQDLGAQLGITAGGGDAAGQGAAGADGGGDGGAGGTSNLAVRAAKDAFTFFGGLVLVVAFLGLGLLEVVDFRTKLGRASGGREPPWVESLHAITLAFQRFVVVRTVVGLITGTLVFAASLAVGLDLAFVWGLTNFVLNYIPTLGSIVAVVPPVLFSLVQFGDAGMALLVLGVVGGVQIVMGNWVDPLLQGRYLSLSPLVVLFSVTFWGWLWGIAGAFIGVPLTVALVIALDHFDRTRWIALLLADEESSREGRRPARRGEGRKPPHGGRASGGSDE